jgi:hypothetical protein
VCYWVEYHQRGDDSGVIEPRILPIIGVVIMGVIVASLIVTGVVTAIVFNIEDDIPVSSNSMLLILLVIHSADGLWLVW